MPTAAHNDGVAHETPAMKGVWLYGGPSTVVGEPKVSGSAVTSADAPRAARASSSAAAMTPMAAHRGRLPNHLSPLNLDDPRDIRAPIRLDPDDNCEYRHDLLTNGQTSRNPAARGVGSLP